ncbi:MAG: Zinc metalloprotease [Parcubacteria group bacterium]|nr:Zinc metalloprotease [Parcubacteria group bacterium]
MSTIYFLIILSVLVLVHEAGHFFTARATGMRIDEFGLGYPPRAKKLFHWKGTDFTLNWLPFGGFVKIFGENSVDTECNPVTSNDSFISKPRHLQAMVLVAGVSANILFAWFLFSIGFMVGMPASSSSDFTVTDVHTVVTEVVAGSPADLAGIHSGDRVEVISRGENVALLSPIPASEFITSSMDPVNITVLRGNEIFTKNISPSQGIVEGKPAVGIALDSVGVAKLPFFASIVQGAKTTWGMIGSITIGLGVFLKNIFTGHADFSQVSGPVGIVGMVGDIRHLGFIYLLSFTALISVNLAVLNLLPFPALDGGRLLFVIIESIIRRPISPKVANALNTAGFLFLILLMILVTFRDVARLI